MGSVAARHSKVHNTANQDLKDGSSVSSEDTRGIAPTDFESVASSAKESLVSDALVFKSAVDYFKKVFCLLYSRCC